MAIKIKDQGQLEVGKALRQSKPRPTPKHGGKKKTEVAKATVPTGAKASKALKIPPSFASYFQLVQKFPLVPIRDDVHLVQALALVEDLLKRDLDDGADSYLNVLTGLIESHESRAFPIPDATEADVLRELMRQHGLSQSALEEKVGIAQPTISAVLKGTRGLTKAQIVTLARFFHVPPGTFLQAT